MIIHIILNIIIIILFIIVLWYIYNNKNYEYFNCKNCKKCKGLEEEECNKCINCSFCKGLAGNTCINSNNFSINKCYKNKKKLKLKKKEYKINKIDLSKYKIHHYDNNCMTRCSNVRNCTLLKEKTINYNKCKKCNNNNKKFVKNITNYECIEKNPYKKNISCNNSNIGCPNYKDLSDPTLIKPYYIIPKDTSKHFNSDDLCKFCWYLN